ncbi:LCP family protein [Nocardia sp. alder85J]|uniref:LCP family protein n=1 Tax=Nocardia sp. alder85J TaxID=2862949 RepID=UPI003A4E2809
MNGEDPRRNARTRRVSPSGAPGAYPPSDNKYPDEAPTRPAPEPTQVMRRDRNTGSPLAYSQTPGSGNPPPHRNPPPAQQRYDRPPPRDPNRGAPPTAGRRPPPPPPQRGWRNPPPDAPRHAGAPPRRRRRPRWGRRLLILLLILIVLPIAALIYLDTSLTRIDALGGYPNRIGDTPGTNWLLAGSDSRDGLTAAQEAQLTTGSTSDAGGERSDTIILVHLPKSGQPTVVSLPRDSYVSIPGHGRDKLNAAFALGGPKLLSQTVEIATGLHIDHFAKIGFGGFAGLVDAVGGIDMCLPQPMNDPLAGIDLPAGCQHLNGPQALGFVRSRATARADLDRMNDQRQFLTALLKKAGSASTLANPLRWWPLAHGATRAVQVNNGDHLWDLARLGWALKGGTVATTVPIGGFTDVSGSGNVLLWDHDRATTFFGDLAADRPLPPDLITAG